MKKKYEANLTITIDTEIIVEAKNKREARKKATNFGKKLAAKMYAWVEVWKNIMEIKEGI